MAATNSFASLILAVAIVFQCVHAQNGNVAVMEQATLPDDSKDTVQLLQTDLLVNDVLGAPAISSSTEHWSGGAKGWLARFPKLEVAVNDKTHAQRCVQIWNALGENRWMEFIDGRAHAGGPNVFDDATSTKSGRASGNETFEHQDIVYDEFSTEGAWNSRWSSNKLAALNARLRGVDCRLPSCADKFDVLGTDISDDEAKLNPHEKSSILNEILAEYYEAIDTIRVPMSDRGGSTHIQQALPYIARLYHKLALLHPFLDGNSRTRTMVLQTELVRQGGHPAVLWDNYWGIYTSVITDDKISLSEPGTDIYGPGSVVGAQLQQFVLDGWCGWETVYNTQASPFVPFVHANGTLLSTPHAEYNAVTDACEEGPARPLWEPAFDKNHQD